MEREVSAGQLRHYATRRSLGRPGTLAAAVAAMQFVQVDPIRAPARAQDLTLRHRVRNYQAGDLDRAYVRLGLEEDRYVNYGYVTRELHDIMHPRVITRPLHWENQEPGISERVLDFVRANGDTHPRQLEAACGSTRTVSGWGQTSKLTTRVLDSLHYRGFLRVARRESGIKIFALADTSPAAVARTDEERARALVHSIINLYAPIPTRTLGQLVGFIEWASPHLKPLARKQLPSMLRDELATATLDGIRYTWPLDEEVDGDAPAKARFLAPFDPVAWDRLRFEHLHGWEYRFEAYTPAAKRLRGYYSLPLLWRERIIGWGNFSVKDGDLVSDIGYVDTPPGSVAFRRELDDELSRFRQFLGLQT